MPTPTSGDQVLFCMEDEIRGAISPMKVLSSVANIYVLLNRGRDDDGRL